MTALSGRRNELGVIANAIARARDGRPATVALVGEPGIGKTRIATEAAAAASAQGFTTWWGRAWEAGGAPAYWPWRQLCEELPRDSIAHLWGAKTAAADPEQARFELFDAVTKAIAARATETPLLCILDDLHVADVPSLELVAFATRHLRAGRVAWLLTWRDAEGGRAPVRDQLLRIAREATMIALPPLSEIDANELIDTVDARADIVLRARLLRATGGNPLFLLETLAALASGHDVPTDDLPLAEGIAAIVRDRIAPLSEATREAAAAAAAIGRDVALARWTAAVESDVRRAAKELVETGILRTAGHERWRFGHDLVREAIYREHDSTVFHRRLAELLDREIAAGDTTLLGERAHHALLAAHPSLITWTVAASEQARAQCAYEEAVGIADRAIQHLGRAREPALQLARARALLDSGEAAKASEAFSLTIALARKADDPCLLAAAVLGLGARYVFGERLFDLVALIDEVMAILPSEHRDLHARLLARKAAALTPAPDPEPVLEMAAEAQRLGMSSADPATRLEVAVALGAALSDFANPHERIPVNEVLVSLAREKGDRALEHRGLTRLTADNIMAGDFARADSLLPALSSLAKLLVQPRFQWQPLLLRSALAQARGDFARSAASIAEAQAYVQHDSNCARAVAFHRTWMLLQADKVDELPAQEPVLIAALRTMSAGHSNIVRAIIRLRTGDLVEARREIAAIEPRFATVRAILLLVATSEVIAEVGPDELRKELYDYLAPNAGSFASSVFGLSFSAPVAATLGNLAGSLGDIERSRAHFESALVFATQTGAIAARAWTAYWYGRTLAKIGHADATRHLQAAIRDAEPLGMAHFVTRCRDAMPQTTAPAPRVTAPIAIPKQPMDWTLTEHGGAWRVDIGDRNFLLPNLRGLPILARLIASPHVEIHSAELSSGSVEPTELGDAGELIDDKARAAYRKRLAALADALEDAQDRGDVARAEDLRDEHEALVKELSRAVGLGGRVRRAGAAAERARVNVQRRLREAIKKIGEHDATLGTHLDEAVRTGTFCVYRP